MNSGRLRHRICIYNQITTQDSYGESDREDRLFAKRWADIRDKKEEESLQSDQVVAKSTHTARIRYLTGLKPEMTIGWGSRTFQIDGIKADRTDAKFQMIDCTEIDV